MDIAMKRVMKNVIGLVFVSSLFASQVQAAIIDIVATQVGNNVVFNGSGSIDLSGLGSSSPFSLNLSRSQFNLFGGISGIVDSYNISIPVFSPFNNTSIVFDSISGDNFSVQGLNSGSTGFLNINQGYVSGDAIQFEWTVANVMLASLNLDFGVKAEFGNNTINLVQGAPGTPIDAPNTLALFFASVLGFRAVRSKSLRSQQGAI